MKKIIMVAFSFYYFLANGMDNEILVKEWSQINADLVEGQNFLKDHNQITNSRKEKELIRFLKSCLSLVENGEKFVGLKFGEQTIEQTNITDAVGRFIKICRKIQKRPLRKAGEKRIQMPEHMQEQGDTSDFTFGTTNSQNPDDNPYLPELFNNLDEFA